MPAQGSGSTGDRVTLSSLSGHGLLQFWIEELAAQRFEAFERALLVRLHQSRIPRHIGGEDRGQPAGLAHVASPAAKRRPER